MNARTKRVKKGRIESTIWHDVGMDTLVGAVCKNSNGEVLRCCLVVMFLDFQKPQQVWADDRGSCLEYGYWGLHLDLHIYTISL